jgi:hypothetical protein
MLDRGLFFFLKATSMLPSVIGSPGGCFDFIASRSR